MQTKGSSMTKVNTILFVVFTIAWAVVSYGLYLGGADQYLLLAFLTMTAWACGCTFQDMMDEVFGEGKWRL